MLANSGLFYYVFFFYGFNILIVVITELNLSYNKSFKGCTENIGVGYSNLKKNVCCEKMFPFKQCGFKNHRTLNNVMARLFLHSLPIKAYERTYLIKNLIFLNYLILKISITK